MLTLIKSESRVINQVNTPTRTYKNSLTGGFITTYQLRQDAEGNTWWTFEDLFALPFIRQLAAKKVLDLYGNGLSLDDIKTITGPLKTILRSQDAEKYDLAMAKVLELENLTETMADPVKQCMGLCTVYLLLNDELPDAYTQAYTAKKMSLLALDVASQSFFLSWWTDIMRNSGQVLKGFPLIASAMASGQSVTSTKEPSS